MGTWQSSNAGVILIEGPSRTAYIVVCTRLRWVNMTISSSSLLLSMLMLLLLLLLLLTNKDRWLVNHKVNYNYDYNGSSDMVTMSYKSVEIN